MSPEYGVVQSVITAQDLRMWTEVYKQGNFGHKDTTANSYFADAQQVFSNIVQGRSIVLLTNDFYCDILQIKGGKCYGCAIYII